MNLTLNLKLLNSKSMESKKESKKEFTVQQGDKNANTLIWKIKTNPDKKLSKKPSIFL